MSELGKNLSATKSAYRMIKKTGMPARFEWRHLSAKADRPMDKNEASTFSEPAHGGCSRTVAEVRLVGVDSTFSAIHTESNWRGAFEHTNPQAAIMAVLALVRRLSEQTQGSHESNEKVAAALNDLIAAFKERKAFVGSLDSAAKEDQSKNGGGELVSDPSKRTVAKSSDSLGALQPKQKPDERSPEGADAPRTAMESPASALSQRG